MKSYYFFDFLSPYSYLSWTWFRDQRDYFNKKNIDISLIPTVLSRIISAYETKGPAEIIPKRDYLFKDCLRFALSHKIPFRTPVRLPFNSMMALRIADQQIAADKQWEIVDLFFCAAWEHGRDLGDLETLRDLLVKNNLDADYLLERESSREGRMQVKLNTKLALKNNVFGLPTFIINDELFWGNDSIPYIKNHLEDRPDFEQDEFNRFKNIFL